MVLFSSLHSSRKDL